MRAQIRAMFQSLTGRLKTVGRALQPLIRRHRRRLYRALRDEKSEVRQPVVFVLGKIGDTRALRLLVHALRRDAVGSVRAAAATALGELGRPHAVNPLRHALLTDADSQVRAAAVSALGHLGDPRALEPLVAAALHDTDGETRDAACDALLPYILADPGALLARPSHQQHALEQCFNPSQVG